MKKRVISILLILGISLSSVISPILSTKVKADIIEPLLSTGFDEPWDEIDVIRVGKWGDDDTQAWRVVKDTTDASNPVLKIVGSTAANDSFFAGINYKLPMGTDSAYKMNISFKVKMSEGADFFATLYDNNAGNSAYGSVSNDRLSIQSTEWESYAVNLIKNQSDAFVYATESNYANAGDNGKRIMMGTISYGEWYTVNSYVNVDPKQRVKVTTEVLNEDGTLFYKYEEIQLAGVNLKAPTYFTIMGKKAVYIDDLCINLIKEPNVIEEVLMTKFNETTLEPVENPIADLKGFRFVLRDEGNIEAVLTSENGEIETEISGSDKTFNVLFKEVLSPGTEYTLTVGYGGEEDYVYIFTPQNADDLMFSSIKLYKNEEEVNSLDDINAGDSVRVTTEVYNFTNETKSAALVVVAEGDGYLKSFNADEQKISVNFSETTVLSRTFTVSENINSINAFVWESVESMKMLTDATVFKTSENTVPDNNDFVSVKGKLDTEGESKYAVMVYAPGKTVDDIDFMDGADNKEVVVYCQQGITDAVGNYKNDFVISGESGIYIPYVYSESSGLKETLEGIKFINKEEYKEQATYLNELVKNEDFIALESYLNENSEKFPFDFTGVSSKENVILMLYGEIKSNPLDVEDISKAEQMYKTVVLADSVNAGDIENLFEYSELFIDEIKNFAKYTDKENDGFVISESMEKEITKKLKGTESENLNDFRSNIVNVFIEEVIKEPNGVEHLRDVLENFEYLTNVNPDKYSDTVLNEIIGKDIKIEDLEEALDEAKSDNNKGSGSSGGKGSSSKGGKGGSLAGMIPQATQPEVKEEVQDRVIGEDIYTDISDVIWAKNAIITLTDLGVLTGFGDLTFRPNELVTREQFVKMIVETFNLQMGENEVEFNDVDKDAWYYSYVKAAYNNGIITGYSEIEFGIGDTITRQDMCVICYKLLKNRIDVKVTDEVTFADAIDIADYAKEAVGTLNDYEVFNGVGNNEFRPMDNATRAQAAKVVYSLMNIK